MSEENKNIFDENNSDSTEQESVNETDTVYFSQEPVEPTENLNNNEAQSVPKKEKKRVSIKALVISIIAVAVASVMLTYSICSALYQSLYAQAYVDANQNSYINGNVTTQSSVSELDVIAQLIKDNYYGEFDTEKMMEAAIEEYIRQTGDLYAAYYTQEELEAMMQEDVGKMVGIGVSITNAIVNYNGKEIAALKVFNVIQNSPAEKAGVKVGDYVYAAIIDGATLTVSELGYDGALDKLLGDEGTTASFLVLREVDGVLQELPTFNIVRESITSESVYYRIPEVTANTDKNVGVIKITNFDFTTPTQFTAAVEALKKQGCTKFVLDLRYNLGGHQASVCAVLSYFLNEGDVYIRTKDKNGTITSETIGVVTDYEGDYAGCNVSKEDIGKYKDLDVAVLCNEFTVSAAELFVATFKDYEIGTVVGNTTYGKGVLQKTYYLQQYALYQYGIFGIDGAVKITTNEYFSAKSDSYNGIGVEPNEKILLSEEAEKLNIYDFKNLDPIDDQLLKAINILNG